MLLAFKDACQEGYGAVVYLKFISDSGEFTSDSGDSKVKFVCAKFKVVPMKMVVTIPMLDLCATVLLLDLLTFRLNNCYVWDA